MRVQLRRSSRRAVAAAVTVGAVVGMALWRAPQVGYRVEHLAAAGCPVDAVSGARPGTDTALLPLAPMSAPLTAVVCRPEQPHVVVHLDPARTAHLSAVVDTPPTGWPSDALLAKRVPPVAAGAVTGCPDTLVALLRFDYPAGPPVPVQVSGGRLPDGAQCLVVDNGRVRWRLSPAVAVTLTTALDELPTG